MAFSSSPQSVYNGLISGQRNMFLSSSLAAIMIGFSDKFENKNVIRIVKVMGLLIFALSIAIGYLSNNDFLYYLDRVKDDLPDYIPINTWYYWCYVSYIYTTIILIIGLLYLFRKVIPN